MKLPTGIRDFLTGEDCVVGIARGPDYRWERLRLVAQLSWQESRVVLPHYGFDDVYFTSASPGVRSVSGSITFYRKSGDVSPLHTNNALRQRQQAGSTQAAVEELKERLNPTAIVASTVGLSPSAQDNVAILEQLRTERDKQRELLSIKGTNPTGLFQSIGDAVKETWKAGGAIFPHIYDSGESGLEEPVDLMFLLSNPKVAGNRNTSFYGAIVIRNVYFTAVGAGVQNIGVEPITETYNFLGQQAFRVDLTGAR